MSDEEEQLKALRDQIDQVDQDIQSLISQRARCAQKVAEVKHRSITTGLAGALFYRPEREAQVLRRVMERNQGPLDSEEMARLFRQIMSACLALEEPMHIAFLGPQGTFTQAAALKHFGHSVISVPLPAIDEVFREVESGEANYGVVPIENSTEGMINHTLDMFVDSMLKICGEVQLRIHHHLLVQPDRKKTPIRKIYSHQQSLAQCRQWLDTHYHEVERIAVSSNAEAARRVKHEPESAAIAGDMAAELYGLLKKSKNIEDQPDNTTRFLIVGNNDVPASGVDKTSILISTRNQPGALYHILEPFHRNDISLTRIETRPSPQSTWSYIFFIDFEGHFDDARIKKVIAELSSSGIIEIKHLGSYPEAVL